MSKGDMSARDHAQTAGVKMRGGADHITMPTEIRTVSEVLIAPAAEEKSPRAPIHPRFPQGVDISGRSASADDAP